MVVILCYYDVMGVESVHFFFICRVHIGLFCCTPDVALGRAVNRKRTLKMLLTGDPITAHGKVLLWFIAYRGVARTLGNN